MSSRRERSGMKNRSSSARQHIFFTSINTNHHNQPNTTAKHILPPSCGEGSLANTHALDAVQLNFAWASMSPNALLCMSGLFCAPVPIRHVQLGPAGTLLGTSVPRHRTPMRQAVHEAARLACSPHFGRSLRSKCIIVGSRRVLHFEATN